MATTASTTDRDSIVVRGVRVHNLKNIDLEIPHNALTIVTGVSGSGKSSLAFDTIYAEGQRRYIESLSAYARQFLERIEKPEIDEVYGIAPAIAIRQRNTARTPRSTVATSTEVYDYLRLLFARVGVTVCRKCGATVQKDTVDQIADAVIQWPLDTRFYVLYPLPKHQPQDQLAALLTDLKRRGFSRIYQNGQTFDYSRPESLLDVDFKKTAYVLVDRLKAEPDIRQRLIDSVEICLRENNGEVILQVVEPPSGNGSMPRERQYRFSESFECKKCGIRYEDPEPQLFSFNNPFGACPRCQGFGNTIDLDPDLIIPDKSKALNQGAIEPWTKPRYRIYFNEFKRKALARRISPSTPFRLLTSEEQTFVMNAVREFFEYLETKKYKLHVRVFLSRYRGYTVCPECGGSRLRQEARDIFINGKNIADVCRMTIQESHEFFSQLTLTPAQAEIAERILLEIQSRLRFLNDVGLQYLTLDRLSSTLSGGEAQRIQLATSLGSSLVGALYVLDEPSIGLHPRDGRRLIKILQRLRDIGNTVLVVEHDAEMMRAADHILDLGPAAGELGGKLIYEGNFSGLLTESQSLTGRYLRGEAEIKEPKHRRPLALKRLKVRGAARHNLKNIDVEIPIGLMTCITGVSGSGKSTLIHDCIYAGLKKQEGEWQGHVGAFQKLEGEQHIDEVILVDQSPIGRTPRSNPVTYIKVYDAIRETFANTREAQARGLEPSHFSFNVPGGRCEVCQGDGTVTVEMQFLADVELVCEECKGTRFKQQVLDVRYRGKNIHEVLNLTVREAITFFRDITKITNRLRVLDDVGLGYLRLGQSATTLSGGEAQRVKLAAHLSKRAGARTLYIFDEPTTGLHFDDINKLLAAFRALIDAGGSLLVIEHNLDVIKTADYIIDLGPEGGDAGGYVVATGTPEAIMKAKDSYTGKYLKKHLAQTNGHGA